MVDSQTVLILGGGVGGIATARVSPKRATTSTRAAARSHSGRRCAIGARVASWS